MRKALCWLLMCLCLVTSASAEVQLLPQVAQWDAALPVEITLSVDVKTHMPFDEERCAQLNALLKHISLRLGTSTDDQAVFSRMAVCVDGHEALRILQKEMKDSAQVQLSWQPGMTVSGNTGVLNELLGQKSEEMGLYGFTGGEAAWLDDGAVMMSNIGTALEEFGKETAIKTAIKNMGTARRKITYTIPQSQAEAFLKAVATHCPDGELKTFLTGLVYSGRQKLILWLTGEGEVIRAEYAGKCGVDEENLRQVSLKWRLRRDDDLIRDDLTLKTPAVKGNDYNTVTCTRDLSKGKNDRVTYALEFSESIRVGKEKTTRAADVELTSQPKGTANRLTGSLMVKQLLPGAGSASSVLIQPDLLVDSDSGTPVVSGMVNVQELRGKAVLEDAAIAIEAGAGTFVDWQETDAVRPLADMTEQERSGMVDAMASALVPYLVLLPQEDTLYLAADLPEDVWQRIVEAARNVLPEEVVQ